MMVWELKDYETAFNFLLDWLEKTRDVVRESVDDSDDEVQIASADGYLTCCTAALMLARQLRCKLTKDGSKKND